MVAHHCARRAAAENDYRYYQETGTRLSAPCREPYAAAGIVINARRHMLARRRLDHAFAIGVIYCREQTCSATHSAVNDVSDARTDAICTEES